MNTLLDFQADITEQNKLICTKYWQRENDEKRNGYIYTIKQLEGEFGLKSRELLELIRPNCRLVLLDVKCKSCDSPQVCYTRTQLTQASLDKYECRQCIYDRNEAYDRAVHAEHLREIEREKLQIEKAVQYAKARRQFQLDNTPAIGEIGVSDKMLLAAVVESLGVTNIGDKFSLNNDLAMPLSPYWTLDVSILKHLSGRNILVLSDGPTLYRMDPDTLDIDYRNALFDIPYSPDELIELSVGSKAHKNVASLVTDDEFVLWCRNIQILECFSYLSEKCESKNLITPSGNKITELLDDCLDKLAVSMVYYIIYKAVESASAFAQKPRITKQHASNSILGNMERVFINIVSGSWAGHESYRPKNKPQSAMCRLFFDCVFGIDDCGFNNTTDKLFSLHQKKSMPMLAGYATLGSVKNNNYSIRIGDNRIC